MSIKDEIIEELKRTRQELTDLVSDIPPEKEIYPEWRLKELLAHFAGWDDAALAGVRSCLAGKDPIIVAPLPLSHIVKEWQLNRELLIDLTAQIPEEKFEITTVFPWGETGTLAEMIRGISGHELFHIGEVRELKPKLMGE